MKQEKCIECPECDGRIKIVSPDDVDVWDHARLFTRCNHCQSYIENRYVVFDLYNEPCCRACQYQLYFSFVALANGAQESARVSL